MSGFDVEPEYLNCPSGWWLPVAADGLRMPELLLLAGDDWPCAYEGRQESSAGSGGIPVFLVCQRALQNFSRSRASLRRRAFSTRREVASFLASRHDSWRVTTTVSRLVTGKDDTGRKTGRK